MKHSYNEGDVYQTDQGTFKLTGGQWVPVQAQSLTIPSGPMQTGQIIPQQQLQQPQQLPQIPQGLSLGNIIEPALTVGSGMVAEPLAGLAGIAGLPFGSEQAARNVAATREALTIPPFSQEGIQGMQAIAAALQPAGEFLQSLEQGAGDIGFDIAGPIGGAIGQTLPTALMSIAGLGGTRGAARIAGGSTVDGALKAALTKGDVLTSDVFPPKTFVGGLVQKVTERVPFLGTGKKRAIQQESRVQALDDLAREFGVDPDSAFDRDIITSANKFFKKSQSRAAEIRGEAVAEFNNLGDVPPVNALREVDTQMQKIVDLGAAGDSALLKLLQSKKSEMFGNFERLKNIRTTIFDDISDMGQAKGAVRSGGDAVLSRVAGALSKDLDDFASAASKSAGGNKELLRAASKWRASNKIFKDNFAKAKQTELKKALTKGNTTPEVINTTIKGGKLSELNRLNSNITKDGRVAVQQQIIKNWMERANGNPTIFVNEMERVNARNATKVFFKGEAKKELDGLKKFLNMTRRAQEAGKGIASQQEIVMASLATGAFFAPTPVLGAAAGIGVLGRGFESKAVRNMLIRLSRMSPTSKKAKELSNNIALAVAEAGQTATKEVINGQ